MKFLLTVIALLPVVAFGSDKDFGGMYENSDLIVEGRLSGDILEKIKVIRESKHPDVDFHEDTFLYTYLVVDGAVKFQKGHQWPDDEVEIQGKKKARYRILIPERYYSKTYKAITTEETHAWFLIPSPLAGSLHAYEYLALSRVRMFIPDYMDGAIGVSLAPERKVSIQSEVSTLFARSSLTP
ncbi:hypothetical protein QEH52_19725 [Coraliomargarita sp. SDUM461003]|uniref:Uncharacterized protein n=1 Tax=Thalassobacterium maritimum TaxID=3041265 RepID=A0ABU1B039_9BACT|nr:hypothetical protein [Coraliomargarita sp. SDUM461003]MDQ8209758.1 hypothetical protein [Coraliomargarita sp. SDUM461003]